MATVRVHHSGPLSYLLIHLAPPFIIIERGYIFVTVGMAVSARSLQSDVCINDCTDQLLFVILIVMLLTKR